MSCDVCEGYSSHNCPCCRPEPAMVVVDVLEADPTKLDIVVDDKVVAVCSQDELLGFIHDNGLRSVIDAEGDVQVYGRGFKFWAFRQHEDSMDLYERSPQCEFPISMHLFGIAK